MSKFPILQTLVKIHDTTIAGDIHFKVAREYINFTCFDQLFVGYIDLFDLSLYINNKFLGHLVKTIPFCTSGYIFPRHDVIKFENHLVRFEDSDGNIQHVGKFYDDKGELKGSIERLDLTYIGFMCFSIKKWIIENCSVDSKLFEDNHSVYEYQSREWLTDFPVIEMLLTEYPQLKTNLISNEHKEQFYMYSSITKSWIECSNSTVELIIEKLFTCHKILKYSQIETPFTINGRKKLREMLFKALLVKLENKYYEFNKKDFQYRISLLILIKKFLLRKN